MPELPEVETILQGIQPYVEGKYLLAVVLRERRLRWQIPLTIKKKFPHHKINHLSRRGKYLLFETDRGTAILHFGMSGSLAILPQQIPPKKHDHFDLLFDGFCLRYSDPRRFGALLWTEDDPHLHPLLAHLGKEPLNADFTAAYLCKLAANRKLSVKQLIMNSRVVVGVGNIYAAEALFLAKIHPLKPANTLSKADCERLVSAIKKVLKIAIQKGGTTLRNFFDSTGKPGYFTQELNVYGRADLPCKICKEKLKKIRMQNRSTFFCPNCQALNN